MQFFVYILKSGKDGGLYVGMSSEVEKRLLAHNRGATTSTKHRRPFTLVYCESHPDRVTARKREKFLKSFAGVAEKVRVVENCQIV